MASVEYLIKQFLTPDKKNLDLSNQNIGDKGAIKLSKAKNLSMEEAKAQRCATIPAGRYGEASEFGAMCAFMCSQHVGYMVGQNVLLDGGATVSTM